MSEMQELKAMMKEVIGRFDKLETRFDALEEKVDYNTKVLDAVIHNQEMSNAKLDGLDKRLVTVEDNIKDSLDISFGLTTLYSVQARKIKALEERLNN